MSDYVGIVRTNIRLARAYETIRFIVGGNRGIEQGIQTTFSLTYVN